MLAAWPIASRTIALVVCLATTALALPGCGQSDDDEIHTTLREIRESFIAEDYGAVCSNLAPAARRQLGSFGHTEPTSCAADLASKLSAEILSPRDRVEPAIQTIEIDGDRATAVTVLGGTTPTALRFVKVDDRWLLSTLFAASGRPANDL
jgi:hypothetical protein